jgi:hypothetical protein
MGKMALLSLTDLMSLPLEEAAAHYSALRARDWERENLSLFFPLLNKERDARQGRVRYKS